MTSSDLFKVMIIERQITWKWYNIQLYLQWPTNRKSYMIHRTAPFSVTLKDPYPKFQGHAIVWRWISQKRYDIQTFRMTLSDLAKHSMTRSVMRSLCDSWASCTIYFQSPQGHDATALAKFTLFECSCFVQLVNLVKLWPLSRYRSSTTVFMVFLIKVVKWPQPKTMLFDVWSYK